MVYQWKDGARISAKAQVAGEMCMRLADQGRLSAKALLDENRPVDAPLHSEFEWNDTLAAEHYRLQQARHIINCLMITPEQSKPVRCFFHIERKENTYQAITTILTRKDDTTKLLEMAMMELRAFERKYSVLLELAKVFQAIKETEIMLESEV